MKENKNKKSIMIAAGIAAIVVIAIILVLTLNKEDKTYNVTFEVNGGSSIEALTINENGTITKPENPTKEGYVFAGWYLNGELYDFNEKVTSDIKLEAKWTKIEESKPDVEDTKPEEDEKDKTIKVTKVSLNKTSLTLTEGESEKLKATVKPTDATNKNVTWKSSNKDVATVDANGNVKALKAGTATITVTTKDGSYKATCKVTVIAKQQEEPKPEEPSVSVTGVTLNKASLTLTEGGSEKLKATVAPSNATNKEVTWKSSNKDVATVDANGNVKALKAGTATITVTTKDGNHTATCTVTVKEKEATYTVTIAPIVQPTGIYQYSVNVTKNGSAFNDFTSVKYNGVTVKPNGTISSWEYDESIKQVTIKVAGETKTATVIYK